MDEMEINIQDLLGIILSRIKLIILITVLLGAAGYSYAKFVMPLQYTSSIKMYVTNTGDIDNRSEEGINVQDQAASRNLASTYIVLLGDDSVYEEISDRLIADYDLADLRNYFTIAADDTGKEYIPVSQIKKLVSITAINNTEVLQVTCTSEVPKFSADICKYISELAPKLLKRMMNAGAVETISPAKVPTAPSGPNIIRFAAIGAFAGLALSVMLVLAIAYFDNTVTGGEEIKARFNVPVLAEIPDIFMDEKGSGGKYGKYGK